MLDDATGEFKKKKDYCHTEWNNKKYVLYHF